MLKQSPSIKVFRFPCVGKALENSSSIDWQTSVFYRKNDNLLHRNLPDMNSALSFIVIVTTVAFVRNLSFCLIRPILMRRFSNLSRILHATSFETKPFSGIRIQNYTIHDLGSLIFFSCRPVRHSYASLVGISVHAYLFIITCILRLGFPW